MEKRYCIFSAQYLPHLGGVERYTYNLANNLAGMGHKVMIVTNCDGNKTIVEKNGNIEIYRLPGIALFNGKMPIIRYNKSFRKGRKLLLSEKFDLVIIQTRYYPLSIFGAWFASKKNIPSIAIDHSTAHIKLGNKILDIFMACYEHILCLIMKHFKCSFYGVSKACTKWLAHFHIHSKGILYNSIDIEQIEKTIREDVDIREIHHLSEKYPYILYAGRLVKEKGIEKLIDAFKGLQKQFPDLYLVVAGNGELYDSLIKRNIPNCAFLGAVEHEKVLHLMKNAELFCLPTDYPEGFPTSVLEAAACKCYVVTTTAGGSNELIINDQYGTILNMHENYSVLQNAIEKVLKNPEMKERVAENCYNLVKEKFLWKRVAEKIYTISEKGV